MFFKKNNSAGLTKRLLVILAVLFIIENLLYFSYFFSQQYPRVLSYSTSSTCPLVCQDLIDKKINLALANLPQAKTTIAKTISYLPLGSGGTTTNQAWSAIPGSNFSFNLGDYPSQAKVYWQGNIKSIYGNSRCYTRLYDKSNFRSVDYSEQSSSQIVFENLTSQPLSIWRGNNQYRLEIKSLNGIECQLESPKLIIKY